MREFDYVVIGGGSAGCVLAGRLSEDPTVRVCLLEAGGSDASVLIHCPAGLAAMARSGAFNWGLHTTPQAGLGGRRGYQPRGKVLGGSSSVNAMIYARGHASDYDHWAAAGNAGWGWNDVLPYFLRAEHNERGASAWHGMDGPLNVADLQSPQRASRAFVEAGVQAGHPRNDDFNGAQLEGVGLYQVTHRAGERFSVAKAYLTPHLGRTNLQVVTGAQAEDVAGAVSDLPVECLVNAQWHEGLAGSVRIAAEALNHPTGATLLLACDQLALDAAHLQTLLEAARRTASSSAATRLGDRIGIPAVVAPGMLQVAQAVQGDRGLRDALNAPSADVICCDAPDLAFDIDTPEDVAIAVARGWLDPLSLTGAHAEGPGQDG